MSDEAACPICSAVMHMNDLYAHVQNHSDIDRIQLLTSNPNGATLLLFAALKLVYTKMGPDVGALYFALSPLLVDAYKNGEVEFKKNRVSFDTFCNDVVTRAKKILRQTQRR